MADSTSDLVRETQRQQSTAENSGCSGVQRSISRGSNPTLVVRTAVELGYNSCQVIRCALEADVDEGRDTLCEKVVRGAVSAGVEADVISRCAVGACDRATVAAVLAATLLEPNYCYFSFRAPDALDPAPPQDPVIDRGYLRPQASPFSF